MRNTTLSSIKKKGREEFVLMWGFAPKGSLKYKKGLEVWAFLDKQLDISYEAGLKRAIYSILGNIKLTEEQIKTLKTELKIKNFPLT